MKQTIMLLTIVSLSAASPLMSGDGSVPIWEPTVISESGKYHLIRNVGDIASTTDTISITADNVDLDLNGFTVSASFNAIHAESVSGLSIHDGFVRGDVDPVRLATVEDFAVRRLVIDSGDDSGLIVLGSRGVIEDVQIRWEWVLIWGDTISVVDSAFGAPLSMTCTNCRLTGNEILEIVVEPASTGNLVQNNVTGRIVVQGNDNLLKGNLVTEFVAPWEWPAKGLEVHGSRNQLSDNTLVSNSQGYGLWFSGASTDNVYRGNTARGNSGTECTGTSSGGDFCDEGTGNTSHGDNYMPGQI